jgi:hypothetical protein
MAMKDKKGKGGDDEEESEFMGLEDMFRKLKVGPLNGALYFTGDKDKPVLIAAHKRKNPEFLGKKAKKEAGTAKGGFGTLRLESGELIFEAISDKVPKSMKKKLKTLLKGEGFAKYKPRIMTPDGELGEEDDDDDEEDEDLKVLAPGGSATKATSGKAPKDDEGGEKDPLAEKDKEAAAEQMAELAPKLQELADGDDEKAADQAEKLQKLLTKAVEAEDWKKVLGTLKVARKLVDSGGTDAAEQKAAKAEEEAEAAEEEKQAKEDMIRARMGEVADQMDEVRGEIADLESELQAALDEAQALLGGGEDEDEDFEARRKDLQKRALDMQKRLKALEKPVSKMEKEMADAAANAKAVEQDEKRIAMIRKRIAAFHKSMEAAEEVGDEIDAAEEEAAEGLDPEKSARLRAAAQKKLKAGLF